jgi:hypothetical protein
MEIGDHIVTVLQHPIEGAGMGDQARAIGGLDQFFDQLVDDIALDT